MRKNRHSKVKKLFFYAFCSASATQIWLMIVLIQCNSRRSFHGSSMHCHLLIVQRAVMGLTPIVWIWMVCESDTLCLSPFFRSYKLFSCYCKCINPPDWHFKLLLLSSNLFQVMRVALFEHLNFVHITPHLTNK